MGSLLRARAGPLAAAASLLALLVVLPSASLGMPLRGLPRVSGGSSATHVRVSDAADLGVSITPDPALAEGADGNLTVALARISATDVLVRRVALQIALPGGAQATSVSAPGWACRRSRADGELACRLKGSPASTRALTSVRLSIDLRAGGPAGTLRVHGSWAQPATGGGLVKRTASDSLRLRPAPPLRVRANAVDGAVGDAVAGLTPPQVVLRGRIDRRGDQPIRYRWLQLCPRTCVRVRWTTPTGGLLAPGQAPDAAFTTPQVSRRTKLRFALKARDARGGVVDTTQVKVLPQSLERLNPRLSATAAAGRAMTVQGRPGRPFRLVAGDRARVDIGGRGATFVRPGGLVRLVGDVRGQRERRVRWSVISGPRGALARARRRGRTLRFRAPPTSGPIIVRMTAWTRDGRFTRDELIDVLDPGVPAVTTQRPRMTSAAHTSLAAGAASAGDDAFCRLVGAVRQGSGDFTIPLASGGALKAQATSPVGAGCSDRETVRFTAGSAELGDFRLEDLHGTVTRDRGLVVESGRLTLPQFWKATERTAAQARAGAARVLSGRAAAATAHAAVDGPSIAFTLPAGESAAARVGVRLGVEGWGDLTGDLALSPSALAKLPLAESLPSGWAMTQLRLGVNPEARQFELSAIAQGPSTTAADSALELDGALTFDGQVDVQVHAADLAVLQSRNGQTVVSATGELTLLPGRRYNANGQAEGGVFPVVDVAVSGAIKGYEPADGLTLSGRVSWSTDGPLEIDGTLVAAAKGTDVKVAVAGSFTSTQDWELRGELTSDSGVRLGDLLTLKRLDGTIRRSGGNLAVSFTGEAADITHIPGLRAREAKVTLSTSDCGVPAETTATTVPLRICLSVDATLEVTLPGTESPLVFKGGLAVDLTTLTFRATGGLASDEPFGPEELRLHDVTLWATNAAPAQAACGEAAAASSSGAAASGVSFGFRAKGEVAGLALNDIRGAYLANNSYCLGADIGAAQLPGSGGTLKPAGGSPAPGCGASDAPALQGLRFTYVSSTATGSFNGRFCLPQELRRRLGRLGEGSGAVHLNLTTADGKTALAGGVTYTLDEPYWLIGAKDENGSAPDDNKAALAFRSLGFTLGVNSSGVDLGLNARGTLRLPKPSGSLGGDAATAGPSETPLTLSATAHLGPKPSLTLETRLGGADAKAPCTPRNEGALRDVFGQKGLTVCQLGVAGELSASPSLSASASFTLPDRWSKELGASNAAFKLGFSVSVAQPCVDLAIDQVDKTRPAMDLFDKGALVTNQAHLLVAPSGCELPRGEGTQRIDPGFKLSFDGVILGTPVKVFAAITRSGEAFAVDAGLSVGSFDLGPLSFGKTDIRLQADPTAGTTSIGVKSSLALGTGSFTLDAAFSVSGSGASRAISIKGSGHVHFSLAGGSYDGGLTLDFVSSAARTEASFSGGLAVDLRIFKYGVHVKTLNYDSNSGGLQALDVTAKGTVAVGPGSLTASGSFTYARNPGKIRINLSGEFSIWGVAKHAVNLDLDLGRLKLPFSFGPKEGAIRIPTQFGVVRVSGLNQGEVDARTDGQTTTDLSHEVEVDSCDKLEFFCLEVHSVKLNRLTGVLEGTVLGVFPLSVSARELATEKNHPPDYVTRFGNLVNESQGRCLDVPGADFKNGQPLGTYACVGAQNERWSLAPPGLFHAAPRPAKCLDATINKGENARVILYDCLQNHPNHRWHFDDRGRLHALTFGNQARCLTAVPTTNASGEVRMGACNDSKEQRWALSGRIRPLVNLTSDNCLGLATASSDPSPSSGLKTQKCQNLNQNAANQFFALTPNSTLQVSGLCVDAVPDQHGLNHTPKAMVCDGSKRQGWELTQAGEFRNRATGLCLISSHTAATERETHPVGLARCEAGFNRFRWDFGA